MSPEIAPPPPPTPHTYSVLGGISSDTRVSWVYLRALQYPGNKSVCLSVLREDQSMAECFSFLILNLTNGANSFCPSQSPVQMDASLLWRMKT